MRENFQHQKHTSEKEEREKETTCSPKNRPTFEKERQAEGPPCP